MRQPETDEARPSPKDFDLFLSHRGANLEIAEDLQRRLENESHADGRPIRVWLDSVDIEPGRSVVGSINDGLERSQRVGLVLTPEYFKSESGWTDAEWSAALFVDPSGRTGRVIPILAENCPYIPPLLRHLNMIDLRGASAASEFQRLVRTLRGETPRKRLVRGQVTGPDGRLSARTLEAELSPIFGDPDEVDEEILCNLLPLYPPERLWFARIRSTLGSGDALRPSFPRRRELQSVIREDRAERGLKPFSPVFVRHGDEIVTFHRLKNPANPLSPIIDARHVRRELLTEWVEGDPARMRVVTALLNLAVQRHLIHRGLSYDHEKRRYFFPPTGDGSESKIKWRKRGRSRTVARRLVDDNGSLTGWRHTAAKLPVIHLGGHWFVQVRPTVVFSRDGTVHSIQGGSTVGPMATAWLARERNRNMAYHTYFWGFVLGSGATPARIRAGDGMFLVDPEPLEVRLARGIVGDQVDLGAELEDADDPDEGVELEEWDLPEEEGGEADESSA